MKLRHQLLLALFLLLGLSAYAQNVSEFQTREPWQQLFKGVALLDSVLVENALEEGAQINQAVNGVTPLVALSLILKDGDLSRKRAFLNFLTAKGATYDLGYADALKHSIKLDNQEYDKAYENKTYAELNWTNERDIEVGWRSLINDCKIALITISKAISHSLDDSKNPLQKEANMLKEQLYRSYLVSETLSLDNEVLHQKGININPLDIIYSLGIEGDYQIPEIKKQFIEYIEKNDLEGFEKLYSKNKIPFAAAHYPRAEYALFNNGSYRLEPSKEIIELAIENGFDVNAPFEDVSGRSKYGRLIERIYRSKGKNSFSSEPDFEFFKSVYSMCMEAGLDMNFTYENGSKIEGLILEIIQRGNKELFNMIPDGQLIANYYYLRFALSDKNNPLLDRILELPYTPNELMQGVFRVIDNPYNQPDITVLEKLLKKEPNLNMRKKGVDEKSFKKYTAVNAILENNRIENKLDYIKLLHQYGADINQSDLKSYGDKKPDSTPLHNLLISRMDITKKLDLLGFLLDKGALPYAKQSSLYTEDLLTFSIAKSPNDNIGPIVDLLLGRNIKVTQMAIDELSNIIKPKDCKTCKKHPELKPYLTKLKSRMN